MRSYIPQPPSTCICKRNGAGKRSEIRYREITAVITDVLNFTSIHRLERALGRKLVSKAVCFAEFQAPETNGSAVPSAQTQAALEMAPHMEISPR